MLKQQITYVNFDDQTVTDTLYFNINKTDFLVNQNLRQELDELHRRMTKIMEQFGGAERELTDDEKQFMIDLVVQFIKLSYGERSEDGEQFNKVGAFERFQQRAAFEGFLLWLFEDTARAMSFMIGVMPKEIRDQIGDDHPELAFDAEPETNTLAAVPDVEGYTGPSVATVVDFTEDDFDKMLAEADDIDPHAGKSPITQAQHDHMQARLNGKQFAQFMSTKYVKL